MSVRSQQAWLPVPISTRKITLSTSPPTRIFDIVTTFNSLGNTTVHGLHLHVTGSGGLSAAVSDTPLIQNMELEALEQKKPPAMLVMSGGEGYIDFRIGE
jgi:hypothetical protein